MQPVCAISTMISGFVCNDPDICHFALVGEQSIVICDEHVCLSVHDDMSVTICQNFTEFSACYL